MPRNGDGSSDNGPFEEAKANLVHGAGEADKIPQHAEKVADLPEGKDEKGLALEGENASGGQSAGIKKGPTVGQGTSA